MERISQWLFFFCVLWAFHLCSCRNLNSTGAWIGVSFETTKVEKLDKKRCSMWRTKSVQEKKLHEPERCYPKLHCLSCWSFLELSLQDCLKSLKLQWKELFVRRESREVLVQAVALNLISSSKKHPSRLLSVYILISDVISSHETCSN